VHQAAAVRAIGRRSRRTRNLPPYCHDGCRIPDAATIAPRHESALPGCLASRAGHNGTVAGDPPDLQAAVPAGVAAVAAGRPLRLVWQNESGGLTFEAGQGASRCFIKWSPAASWIDLAAEAGRLEWAAPFHPVPRVLAHGTDPAGSWLVTAALAGDNAVSQNWAAHPATAVRAIGAGLRSLHEALPVATCPFSWSAGDRLADARRQAAAGRLDPQCWHEIHRRLGIAEALRLAADVPPAGRLVVCHGDACAPNTLISPGGCWSGHVDLGLLGIADRWADIAVATWSAEWNYGPGWEPLLLDAYGIQPDPERTRYYRLLWDLSS
jgi:aminoglycoside phosphotransferase